jgi:hypothetical protein
METSYISAMRSLGRSGCHQCPVEGLADEHGLHLLHGIRTCATKLCAISTLVPGWL